MKSLEIINERINKLKGKPELVYYDGHKINCLFHNGEGAGLLTYSQLETIKQSLEVLETLRKKKVNIDYLYLLYTWYRDYNYDNPIICTLEKYNDQLEFNRQITQEELTKIIQWLEEHE